MKFKIIKPNTHGNGKFEREKIRCCGAETIIEDGVLVFHPENISIGDKVYIGHNTILKGYYKNEMIIGDGTWIGQNCFFHSAGGIEIGKAVGVGPGVKILTSNHVNEELDRPVLHNPIEFKPVIVKDGADLGVGAVLLPGVIVGKGAIVGAGSVVTKDVEDYAIVVGNPARRIKLRKLK